MNIPIYPVFTQYGTTGKGPGIWWGDAAPDGDADPWITAPLGSLYIRTNAGNVVLYLKDEDNSADADWAPVTVT